MKNTNTNYFKVIAKCGHVGAGHYIPVSFPIFASSKSEAAQIVLGFPRVKKHLKDAIISIEAIDKKTYKSIKKANKENPYLACKTNKDQFRISGIEDLIFKNVSRRKRKKEEPAKNMKYKRERYEFGGFLSAWYEA